MSKILLIGLKDLRLMFRDRPALMFMLLAPFLLTLGMGFVTGRFSGGSSSGLQDIPVVVVNLDQGELGNALADVFTSEDLTELVEASTAADPDSARQLVDEDQAAAAVIIPDGFTESIIPTEQMISAARAGQQAEAVQIEVYTNPARPTSAGVIQAIVEEFISRVEEGRISGMTAIMGIPGLLSLPAEEIEAQARAMFSDSDRQDFASAAINLQTDRSGAEATEFDPLAYLAPGMALMFLMYTVSHGGRSILLERSLGTLPRLLVSPTSSTQVLGGKVLGIFLTGLAQMTILIAASTLLFGVKWGDPLGIAALVVAAVFGATGWGMLITAVARTPGQVGALGSAIMLTFGMLGGSFIQLDMMPPVVRLVSGITPNAWGLDGFQTLALGGTLANLGKPLGALLVMGVVLFAAAAVMFSRTNLVKK